MESGFFGRQLLNEGNLPLSDNLKVRIFQSFYNYYNQSKWILVDGIPGTNTANAMKYYFPAHYRTFDRLYEKSLEYIKNNNLSDLKTLNDIHNLRVLQSILCLAGETNVMPDGVLGPITKAAIKEKLGVDDITKVSDDALKKLTDEASANVKATDMSFEADGFKVDGSTAGGTTADANTSTTDANTSTTDANAEQIKKHNEIFINGLKRLIGQVKPYWYQFGTFKFDRETDKEQNYIHIDIFDKNGTELKNYYLSHPTKTFNDSAKGRFENEGCWRYIDATKRIYFFKCGEASEGKYRLNEKPESLSNIAYTYGG